MKNKIIICIYFLVLSFSACLPDDELKTTFNYEAINIGDGWEASTPAMEGFNESQFRSSIQPLFSEDNYVTSLSLIVVRNGKLVSECYTRNINDRYQKRQIQSITKCITSLVFGIAKDMNYFSNLDRKLFEIIPEAFDSDTRKREITLRHLLTMNSGLNFNNDDFSEELFMKKQNNVSKYILSKPLFAMPGMVYNYRDCDPQLLSSAINKATGMPLNQFADINLFRSLGINDYFWEKNEDGESWGSEALFMRPRDMAKIGQLILNKGKLYGKQIISENWIEESTKTQSDPNAGQPENTKVTFGYYWRLQPNRTGIEANGAGGQQILIIPDKNLVMVFLCEPYVEGKYSLATANYKISQAIINSIIK